MKREQIPNALTALRVFLAFLIFLILSLYLACRTGGGGALGPSTYDETRLGQFFTEWGRVLLNGNFVLFCLAAFSDALDGLLARRWEVESVFGRIADPFADKVMIAGTFVLLIPLGEEVLFLSPWMVVAMLAREQLVTTIRAYAESAGVAFPANAWGKAKMMLQSFCGGTLLLYVANGELVNPWAMPIVRVLIWLTLAVTLYSGWTYIQRARTELAKPPEERGAGPEEAAKAEAEGLKEAAEPARLPAASPPEQDSV